MTIREFYLSVINGTGCTEETMQKARELLEKHDAANEKRKGTESKEKKEVAERRAAVLAFLQANDGAWTRDQISFEIDMDPAKVSGACKGLIDAGLATKSEIKVEKSRKIAYSAVK